MPQMKPMIWMLMLMCTFIVLVTFSSITHFSYSDKLPMMSPNPNLSQQLPRTLNKKNNDK